jgi:hypothetical protein
MSKSKYTELDALIIKTIDRVGVFRDAARAHALITKAVDAAPFHGPSEKLIRRRLEALAKRGMINKDRGPFGYDVVTWRSINPETHRRQKAAAAKRKANAVKVRKVFLELGFATDPVSIKVPAEPEPDYCPTCKGSGDGSPSGNYEESCPACEGWGMTKDWQAKQRAHERAKERRDAAERHLDRVCSDWDGDVELTADQFLQLVADAKRTV